MADLSIKVDGREYPLVGVAELTWKERRELKRLSGGMTASEFEAAWKAADPDAWYALTLLSVRRVDPTFPDDGLDGVNFEQVLEDWIAKLNAVAAEAGAEGDASPPDEPAPSGRQEPPSAPNDSSDNSLDGAASPR